MMAMCVCVCVCEVLQIHTCWYGIIITSLLFLWCCTCTVCVWSHSQQPMMGNYVAATLLSQLHLTISCSIRGLSLGW